VSNNDDEVYLVPVQQVLGNSNLTYLSGANDLHFRSSSRQFRNGIDITTEVVDGELIPQICQLAELGRLNELNNPDLLTELIIETVSQNNNIFKRLFTSDQRTVRYPLKLDDILDCLLREKLARHYREEIVTRKRQNGEIQDVWNGTIVSYSYSPTLADAAEVSQNVELAISTGVLPNIRTRHLDFERLETSLSTAVNALLRNRNEIKSPLFKEVGLTHGNPVSAEDLKVYLGNLYSTFLSNYKALIETNFPTLRSHFKLYSEFPVSVFLVLGALDDRDRYASTPLRIYFSKAKFGQNVVEVVKEVEWKRSEDGLHLTIGGIVHDGISMISTTVENLLMSSWGLTYDRFRGMPLRMLVYSTIRKELSAVEDVFRNHVKDLYLIARKSDPCN